MPMPLIFCTGPMLKPEPLGDIMQKPLGLERFPPLSRGIRRVRFGTTFGETFTHTYIYIYMTCVYIYILYRTRSYVRVKTKRF